MLIYAEMVSMTENMNSDESKNFAFYLRRFDDKCWRIANIIEEFSNMISWNYDEMYQYCKLIQKDLDFILAWYAFSYIADEYEEVELTEDEWQRISDGLSSITIADDIVSLEQVLDVAMKALGR